MKAVQNALTSIDVAPAARKAASDMISKWQSEGKNLAPTETTVNLYLALKQVFAAEKKMKGTERRVTPEMLTDRF